MAEAQIGIFGTVRTDGPGCYVYFAVRWDEPSAEGSITVADPRPTAKRFSSLNRGWIRYQRIQAS